MPQDWETLERVFNEALELPPEERLAFVRDQSADNLWLRHELETLLAVPESKSDAAFNSGTGIVRELLAALDSEYAVGREIGGFRIESLISSGGMGIVYKAVDTATGESVALKLLPPEDSRNPQRIRRLAREAAVLQKLRHPGIVRIKEYRQEPDGHFLVMELVAGETLQTLLARGPIPLGQALDWGAQIAAAVEAAHEQSVVHRDLKPGNIMIESATGRAKLLDFGLARIAGAPLSPHTQTTVEGTVAGTFSYFSPEQANGGRGDERSDIFSFGAVLYEMVAGRRPFDRPGAVATAAAVLTEQPDPFPAQVPLPVRALIGRCLEKDPARRFAAMRQVAESLQELHHLELRGRLKPPMRRRKRVVAAALALAGTLAAGWLLGVRPPVAQVRSLAVLPFTNGDADSTNQYVVDGFTEELTHDLANRQNLRVASRSAVAPFKNGPRNLVDIGHRLKVAYLVEASLQHIGNRIRVLASLTRASDGMRIWTKTYENADGHLTVMRADLAAGIGDSLGAPAAQERYVPDEQAHDFYLKARFEANQSTPAANALAQRDYQRAIELDAGYSAAYMGLCGAIWDENIVARTRPITAERRRAEQFCRKALELDPGSADAHGMMAMFAMQYDWDWSRAERELRTASASGPNSGVECHYAFLCLILGRRAEADRHLRRAREIDPLSSRVARDATTILGLEGRFDELHQEALQLASGDANAIGPQMALNGAYAQGGKLDLAIQNLRALLPEHPEVAIDLANYEASAGNREEALRILRPLEEHEQENQMLRYWFARPYAAMGDEDNAVKWLERSMDAREFVAIYIHVDPAFNSLQNTPVFHALKKRMNLDW